MTVFAALIIAGSVVATGLVLAHRLSRLETLLYALYGRLDVPTEDWSDLDETCPDCAECGPDCECHRRSSVADIKLDDLTTDDGASN